MRRYLYITRHLEDVAENRKIQAPYLKHRKKRGKLAGGRKLSVGSVKNVSDRRSSRNNEQFERWERHCTTVFNHIISSEVSDCV